MQPVVETVNGLKRRVDLTVVLADVEKEVQSQLKHVSRNAKADGFRPGKVPRTMIERTHGPGIRYDVINTQAGHAFNLAIDEAKLRVAGTPSFEPKTEGVNEEVLTLTATFEVYPEIALPDLSGLAVKRYITSVGNSEVDRTLNVLRKQRATFEAVDDRVALDDDRVTLDFDGTIDDVSFEGGRASGFSFVLGEGRMLPEFESATRGLKQGEKKVFLLSFPSDYQSTEVAGKTAKFTIAVKEVAKPVLPKVDGEFAKLLGQAEGDVSKLRHDILKNIQREVTMRVQGKTKDSVMNALAEAVTFEVPRVLIDSDVQVRVAAARAELKKRGVPNAESISIPVEDFSLQSERRVRLGLLIGELVQVENLKATPEQVRAHIEDFAQNYADPTQVVSYYLSDRKRRAEVEAIVLEDNVVSHLTAKARVTEEQIPFEQLMGME